jgi:hypothetical protein
MILNLPERIDSPLLCPVCYRTQHASAAFLLRVITAEMRQVLDTADERVPAGAHASLATGFEQLLRLERALGGLGGED